MQPDTTALVAAITTTLMILSGVLNIWQRHKSGELKRAATEAQSWRGSSEAYKAELEAAHERRNRLQTELTTCSEELAILRAKTDITAISKALESLSAESRQSDARLLQSVTENTTMLKAFQSQMAGVFDAYQRSANEVVTLLRAINENTRNGK